jgi:hypothetical protein
VWILSQAETHVAISLASWGLGDEAEEFLQRLERARDPYVQFCAKMAYVNFLSMRHLCDESMVKVVEAKGLLRTRVNPSLMPPVVKSELSIENIKKLPPSQRFAQLLWNLAQSHQAHKKMVLSVYADVGEPAPIGPEMGVEIDTISLPDREQQLYAKLIVQRAERLHLGDSQFIDSLVQMTTMPNAVIARRQLKDYCSKELKAGKSRMEIAQVVTLHPEFYRLFIDRCYKIFLGRECGEPEFQFWLGGLGKTSGVETLQQMRMHFAAAPEARSFVRKSHRSYADYLCEVFAGRKAGNMEKMRIDKAGALLP